MTPKACVLNITSLHVEVFLSFLEILRHVELRHTNLAYMTVLARSSNFASKWRGFYNKFKTISKILKMDFRRKATHKVS